MSFSDSVANGLRAAFAMARARKDWAEGMDMSPEAVFRSFWSVPLAIPAMALITESGRQLQAQGGAEVVGPAIAIADSIVTSLVIWALVVAFYCQVARKIGAGWRISPLLIANNYATLLAYLVYAILLATGVAMGSSTVVALTWPVVLGFGLWLDWGMVRRALGLPPDAAIVTIAFVQIAALMVSYLINTVFGVVMAIFASAG